MRLQRESANTILGRHVSVILLFLHFVDWRNGYVYQDKKSLIMFSVKSFKVTFLTEYYVNAKTGLSAGFHTLVDL